MTGQLTYSGVTGPGQSLTAAIFPNLQRIEYDLAKETIKVTYDQPEKTVYLDMRASSSISTTVVAGVSANTTIS